MKTLKLTALSWLVATVAMAAGPTPAFITREVTGEAAIVADNREKAERDARNAALRDAVEQVAGVLVSSDTLTANSQLVSDRIYANSTGYVRRYEVLEKKEEGGVLKVTVRAEVGTEQLDKDLQAVKALVAAFGNRKLVILLQEQTLDEKNAILNTGTMSTVLTEAFKKDGWTSIDPHFAAGKVKLQPGVTLTAAEAKEIGDLTRADYILYGTVVFRQQPPARNSAIPEVDAQGNQLVFFVTGEYDLAVFATDSGSQLAKVSGKFSSGQADVGGDVTIGGFPTRAMFSYERTAHEISRHRGEKIVSEVRSRVIEYLRDAMQNGNRVVMTVLGLRDYGAVQAFKKVLAESISGMREVRPGEFGSGKARFDVVFVGSTDDLAEQVGGKAFKGRKISVTGVSGNTVELTLAK